MAGTYLTCAQAARILGISRSSVLRAVKAGQLNVAYRVPGGAYRFMLPDVERYARWRELRHQVEEHAEAVTRAEARQAGAGAGADMAGWVEQLASLTEGGASDAGTTIANLLALLADSLQVGAIVLARRDEQSWLATFVHDPAGVGLQVGAQMPWPEAFAQAFADQSGDALLVKEVRTGARVAHASERELAGVGTLTAVPVRTTAGQLYGALCTLHPAARNVRGEEASLLRLAGRMAMHSLEEAGLRERERQAADQAAQLAAIVEQSRDAIFRVSESGVIQTWNAAAVQLYGYPAEEAIGLSIRRLVAPDHVEEQTGLLEQIQHGQDVVDLETVRVRRDGRPIDVSLTVTAMRDAGGRLLGASTIARDIGERKRADEALRESERQYRLLWEHTPTGIGLFEAVSSESGMPLDFRFLEVNPAFERIAGLSANELVGKTIRAMHLHSESWWLETGSAVARTGQPLVYQYHDHVRDRHYDVHAYRPAPGHVAVMFVEITDRLHAEAALRRNEQEFRLLAENSSDMIVRLGADLTVLYVSPAARQLVGFDPSELVGRHGLELIHPDDLENVRTALSRLPQGPAKAPTGYRHKRGDGGYVWVESTGRSVRDAATGEVLEFQITTRDATERIEREQALRELARERSEQAAIAEALSEASAALASVLEPEPVYARILAQMARVVPCTGAYIFAYRGSSVVVAGAYGEPQPPEGLQLPPISGPEGLLGPRDQPRLLNETRDTPGWQVLAPWEGEYEVRSTIILPLVVHGETYGCLALASSAPNTYTQRHLEVARAFSERCVQALWNARQYQLEQKRARLAEQLAELRNDFVATVSHELRTPLTTVLGYAEVLDAHWSQLSEAQRRTNLQRIVLAANRQKRLIDDLLRVSTFESTEPTLHIQAVPLLRVVAQAVDVVNASYGNQPIDATGPPGLMALADAAHVEQVLINLLDNAAKYSAEGSAVEVSWGTEDGMTLVRVRDHGPGIPEEGRAMLFTRFGRVPGSRMRAGRVGTGLGLYLGREYARAMGGTLELESTGPCGSVFCLRLPAAAN